MLRTPCVFGMLFSLTWLAAAPAVAEEPVSFRREVMAVLSRAGCNQGACHGNLNGKGGFKLSLLGQDPAADLAALTRDTFARRTDPLRPDESLILRKATGRVPHEGGPRFAADSPECRLLRSWIAAGCPDDRPDLPRLVGLEVTPTSRILFDPADHVKVDAVAHFSDGTTCDVTRLA